MNERAAAFRRNDDLEQVLQDLNRCLDAGGPDRRLPPGAPMVLIVGTPRSGSTLALQWLAATGSFGYPSNLIARFWRRPSVGANVQRMLFEPELQHREEFADLQPATPVGTTSELGKTDGVLAPNEFWFWWRQFLPFDDSEVLSPAALAAVDWAGFQNQARELAATLGGPFVMKGLLAFAHLDLVADALPEAVFLHLHRDPLGLIRSMRRARVLHNGDEHAWWSLRPEDVATIKTLPLGPQLAAQAHAIARTTSARLAGLAPARVVRVAHADLVQDPARALAPLLARVQVGPVDAPPFTPSASGDDGSEPVDDVERAALEAWQQLDRVHGPAVPGSGQRPE